MNTRIIISIIAMATLPATAQQVELQEIVVKGNAKATKVIDNGISYNMALNQRAQQENALQALEYVPLIDVNLDGELTVQGSSSYSLYVNGRQWEMAETSPKVFLQSLSAKDIARVEVITNPTAKYGPSAKQYVINIVLKQPALDGYATNISAGGNTQPQANATVTGMAKRGKVEAAVSYNYDFDGQRNQPVSTTYTTDSQQWAIRGKGNGNWHKHTGRAMLSRQIDSLNTIYADIHVRINQSNFNTKYITDNILPLYQPDIASSTDHSHYTSGTVETNLLYHNFMPQHPGIERLTIGYHYTFNPDKRNFEQNNYATQQSTSGGLNEHSLLASYLMMLTPTNYLRLTARNTYRNGDTESTYNATSSSDKMQYKNNIAEAKAIYLGYAGQFTLQSKLAIQSDYMNMQLPNAPQLSYSRHNFYILPSATVYYNMNRNNSIYVTYGTSLTRPEISMLNPFYNEINASQYSVGNPQLKPQYTHRSAANWMYSGCSKLTLAVFAEYAHSSNRIINYYQLGDDERMMSTYDNIGKEDIATIGFNAQLNATSWLMLSANGTVGYRWLKSNLYDLHQRDFTYNFTPTATVLLPDHWRIQTSVGIYKSAPMPWSNNKQLTMYSLNLGKSFMGGRLSLSAWAKSPFNKYTRAENYTVLPHISQQKENYITARSFGLSVAYTLSSGKKVDIERDKTMRSSDQSTGVE